MTCKGVINDQGRLLQIDLLKLFVIALVIWGHCIQNFSHNLYSEELFIEFFIPFTCPCL